MQKEIPQIHLIEGPVGAVSLRLPYECGTILSRLISNLDEWMATLFPPGRPPSGVMEWYAER